MRDHRVRIASHQQEYLSPKLSIDLVCLILLGTHQLNPLQIATHKRLHRIVQHLPAKNRELAKIDDIGPPLFSFNLQSCLCKINRQVRAALEVCNNFKGGTNVTQVSPHRVLQPDDLHAE